MAQCGGDLLSRRLHPETVEGLCQGLLDLDDDKFGAMCSAFGYLQEWPDLSSMCGTNLGAPGVASPVAGNGNGNDDSSCSGGFRKRKPEACLDAKVSDLWAMCSACSVSCVSSTDNCAITLAE